MRNETPKPQQYLGWCIVAISFLHLAVTFFDYDSLSLRALWFVGSGFALLLIGGLNVTTGRLSPQQFGEMRDLRSLTLVADGTGITLGLLFIYMTSGTQPQGPVLVALFLAAAFFQFRRSNVASSN